MQRSSRQSSGRRNYTRNSNAFKFHNFIFNEDNQSFCLEEQHGNKKITVLHWKKQEDRSTPDDERPLEPVPLSKSGKTVSRQLSKTSSDSTSASKRRTHEVTTSASFPPASGRAAVSSPTLPLSPCCSNASLTPSLPPSSPPSSLRHTCSGPSHLSPSDAFQSMLSEHLSKSSSQLESPVSKWNASSSSIATSSSSSSSQVAKWLNQSLHDLDLAELPNRSALNKRKPIQVRRIVVDDDDSDKSDAESDKEMPPEPESDTANAFEKYRRYLQNVEDQFDEIQTQPLDLSTKSKRDLNNNTSDWNIDSILGVKRTERREEDDVRSVGDSVDSHTSSNTKMDHLKQGFDRLQVPSSSSAWLPDWDSSKSSFRSEAVSPSTLISPVKCCSPRSSELPNHAPSACPNPFMFPSPLLGQSHHPSSSFASHSASSSKYLPQRADESIASERRSKFVLDSFQDRLEEEISKMLQTSPKSSLKLERADIEGRIEDKLRSLHREVLSRKEAFKEGQEHLKMHFKLDSNRNLELFGGEGRRNLSEPSLHQTLLSRGRPSQRNQIKRQLEDTFKQNGFLVKTKQVSDANNSAMFCKFRQLRKYTRYYLKSWQNHLPDEVNKLWKGFLPPKTERPLYLGSSSALFPECSSSSMSYSPPGS